jgi:hypothetical protein
VRETAHHPDVLAPGQVLVDGGVLAGQADDASHRVGFFDHVVAEDGGGAGVGSQNGGEDPHRRGLAGPVGPEQAENGAFFDVERDTIEGAHVAPREDLDQIVGLDGVGGRITHEKRNLVIK